MKRLITEEQEEQIARDFRAGVPAMELAKQFGIARHLVYVALRRQKATAREIGRPRLTSHSTSRVKRDADIIQTYKTGATIKETGQRFGLGPTATRKILLKAGVLRPLFGSVSPEIQSEILKRWERGESQTRIGAALGLDQLKVSRLLASLGKSPERRNRREQHGAWKGGRWIDGQGYVRVIVPAAHPLSSMAHHDGYCLEHRLVMAESLGRPIRADESVHHVNGDKTDNRIENLQLRTGWHGHGVALQCADCGSRNIVKVNI